MTQRIHQIIALLALSLPAGAAFAAGPETYTPEMVAGLWSRDGHKEKLEFFACDGNLCAKGLKPLPDGSGPPLVLRHAPRISPNEWKGDLFNPEDGRTYTGTITIDAPNKLTLSGCLMSFLCRSETWTKIPKPPAAPATAAPPAAAGAPAAPAPAATAHPPAAPAAGAAPAPAHPAPAAQKPAPAKTPAGANAPQKPPAAAAPHKPAPSAPPAAHKPAPAPAASAPAPDKPADE